MKVEIWSDVVCPWCHVGKRRFESALAGFEHRDDVEVVWRSFELDPAAPRLHEGEPVARLAAKYGMDLDEARASYRHMTEVAGEEGLEFRLEATRSGNTFDAHRLLHLAAETGDQDKLKERLLTAYLTEGEAIGESSTLERLAVEAGLDPSRVTAVLSTTAYGDEVRADEAQATALGIDGVPFFVFDRKHGVSGARPAETLLDMLVRAWSEDRPLTVVEGSGGACDGESCAV
ncbi:MAG: disulfide bond formation protein DsbA [Acidimicrobiales bacterium]|nr:MAG: disulfide bond formation protein DsbA [Acidimicrobiales bacterium]